MGVDSIKNYSGAQAGELDPIYGMLWDWNSGYVYYKHEGEFIDSTGAVQPLVYHYGTLAGLVSHELTIALPVSTAPRTIKIAFNVNKAYNSPNMIDFDTDNFNTSTPVWVKVMKKNFADSFSIVSIQ